MMSSTESSGTRAPYLASPEGLIALFHNAWILHGATPNRSSTMREAMIVTYYPDGTRVDELSNPNRENDARVRRQTAGRA